MEERTFGFQIGKRVIDINSINEKEATKKLIDENWGIIDKIGKIEFLGEKGFKTQQHNGSD